MATISMSRCDICRMTIEDRYTHTGWIHIEGSYGLVISVKRDAGGSAISRYFASNDQVQDFCSETCLIKWLSGIR